MDNSSKVTIPRDEILNCRIPSTRTRNRIGPTCLIFKRRNTTFIRDRYTKLTDNKGLVLRR